MSFKFEIDTDNAAFDDEDGDLAGETARILRDVAAKVEDGRTSGRAVDFNGNIVGYWRFTS